MQWTAALVQPLYGNHKEDDRHWGEGLWSLSFDFEDQCQGWQLRNSCAPCRRPDGVGPAEMAKGKILGQFAEVLQFELRADGRARWSFHLSEAWAHADGRLDHEDFKRWKVCQQDNWAGRNSAKCDAKTDTYVDSADGARYDRRPSWKDGVEIPKHHWNRPLLRPWPSRHLVHDSVAVKFPEEADAACMTGNATFRGVCDGHGFLYELKCRKTWCKPGRRWRRPRKTPFGDLLRYRLEWPKDQSTFCDVSCVCDGFQYDPCHLQVAENCVFEFSWVRIVCRSCSVLWGHLLEADLCVHGGYLRRWDPACLKDGQLSGKNFGTTSWRDGQIVSHWWQTSLVATACGGKDRCSASNSWSVQYMVILPPKRLDLRGWKRCSVWWSMWTIAMIIAELARRSSMTWRPRTP